MIRCLHCGTETTNGLALCELCRRAALTYLEFIPVHFGNLARWRPGRAGGRPVPGSREPQGAFGGIRGDRVARCLDEAGNDLTTRVRQLEDDRGVETPYAADEVSTIRVACWLLSDNLISISTLDWCGDLVADLQAIEARLRVMSERVVPGWYAGACQTCDTSTHVIPGLSWVTCGGCGATTYARDHLGTILEEARGWTDRPKAVAGALVALLDAEHSVERLYGRIRKWESLGWLESVRRLDSDGDPVGPKQYRLGDVLDVLTRQARPEIMTSA